MNYEQKYKEALKIIESLYNVVRYQSSSDALLVSQTIEKAFPELRESEDDRIRKTVLKMITDMDGGYPFEKYGIIKKDAIAWLEKQGEQKHTPKYKIGDCIKYRGEKYKITNVTIMDNNFYYDVSLIGTPSDSEEVVTSIGMAAEEQMFKIEYNPADEFETKFKVGDWIVTPNGETKQIEKVTFGNYYFTDKTLYNIIDTDNKGHLWTIQDAKDGDVLFSRKNPFIFRNFGDKYHPNSPTAYCGINSSDNFVLSTGIYWWTADASYPATKEQCDLLFQKMKEAGYEWDAEKKELRKIETSTWSEEDEKMCQETIDWFEKKCFPYALENENPARESIKWLKSLKDRVQPQPKQEWSEEDEKIMKRIDSLLYSKCTIHGSEYENIHNWLKSLKPQNRWKPSKEQMEALNKAKNSPANYYTTILELQSLYNDLKKL